MTKLHLLWLVSLLAACAPVSDTNAAGEFNSPLYRLSPEQPSVVADISAITDPVIAINIESITNPVGDAFVITIHSPHSPSSPSGGERDDNGSRTYGHVVPFPADNTGCYAVRIENGTGTVELELGSVNNGELPESVELRITTPKNC